MQSKTVYVKATFRSVMREVQRKVPTGKTMTGFFGRVKQETKTVIEHEVAGQSDCYINGEQLTADIEAAIKKLNNEGYEVISVMPIISGNYAYDCNSGVAGEGAWGWGYGYGYSFTEGVTIIARRA